MRLSSALLFSVALVAAVAALAITSEPDQGPRYVAIPSPYPTIEWGLIWAPKPTTVVGSPVQILTATDTHYLVADAACTVTAIATDGDCWSHTSGGAGGAGVPGQNNAAVMDVNSGGGTFTVDAAMSIASLDMTGSTGTLSLGSATTTVYGNWTSRTVTISTSTVVFAADGNLSVAASAATKFYNLTINDGVTVTNTTATSGSFFVSVDNLLTINGTLLGGSPNDPQKIFMAQGTQTTPVALGANADVDSSGYFIYRMGGSVTYNVASGLYQHLGVSGFAGGTANLTGTISTPNCGVYNECAIIFWGASPGGGFTANTNGYSVSAGGTLWLGDAGTFIVTFNAGSSVISAYGISPNMNGGTVNWGTATVTARPSSTETNRCHYPGTTGYTENLQSSTWSCYGQFRTGSTLDAGSATINVLRASGGASEVGSDQAGATSPGEVVISNGGVIDMGSSTWFADSLWQNNNAGAQSGWDPGTSSVTFRQTGINSDYNFGGTTLGEAELYDVVFDFSGTGAASATMVTDTLWAANSVTFRDTSGGSTSMDTQNLDVRAPTLTVGPGATLTTTGNLVGVNRLDVDGTLSMDGVTVDNIDLSLNGGATMDVTAWTAYDLSASFDVRWTVASVSDTAALTITLAELTHTAGTDYTLSRNSVAVRDVRVGVSETVVEFVLGGGWGASDALALTSALSPPTGGGGPPSPVIDPLWALLGGGALLIYYVYSRTRKQGKRRA